MSSNDSCSKYTDKIFLNTNYCYAELNFSGGLVNHGKNV